MSFNCFMLESCKTFQQFIILHITKQMLFSIYDCVMMHVSEFVSYLQWICKFYILIMHQW